MKKYLLLLMALVLISIPGVMAQAASPRISPMWPVMVESSYSFDVWAQNADVYDCKVLFVVTQECYDAMPLAPTTAVTANAATLTKDDFTSASLNSDKIPPASINGYTVASLKDHIDEGLTVPLGANDTIYWALSDVVFDPLTAPNTNPEQLDVTLDSSAPRMLVYLMGNLVDNSGELDTRTPPTNPGFMVPEITLGSVMAVASMFTALGLYTYKRKQA
jgi:hypothetical protein